jgi:hypothetical protein
MSTSKIRSILIGFVAALALALASLGATAQPASAIGTGADNDHGQISRASVLGSYMKAYRSDGTYVKVYPGQKIPGWAKKIKPSPGEKACHLNVIGFKSGGTICFTKKRSSGTIDWTYTLKTI